MISRRKSSTRKRDKAAAFKTLNSPVPDADSPVADKDEYKKRLLDEYKILQDKIDKIGGFRFTVKGWSVTALIAASAAGTAAKSISIALTITIGLVLMLVFFFSFELEQVRLSRAFGRRAKKLEDEFIKIDTMAGHSPIRVPYTASEILRIARSKSQGGQSENWKERWRVWRSADIRFYVVLSLLALAPPLLLAYSRGMLPFLPVARSFQAAQSAQLPSRTTGLIQGRTQREASKRDGH
jgi:hypothetical protein